MRTISLFRSPFKFLDAFTAADHPYFFGRERELQSLIKIFSRSPLGILYGPSGSGKSSLINCGLRNSQLLQSESIISIRKGEHYIKSIQKYAFNDDLRFDRIMDEFYHSDKKIQQLYHEYRREGQEINRASNDVEGGLMQEEKYNQIASNKQRRREEIKQELTLLEETKKSVLNDLSTTMITLRRRFNNAPYLIFDQFEEL